MATFRTLLLPLRRERTFDLLAIFAIVGAGVFQAYKALAIHSPLVVDDEYQFLLTGLSYGNMQWAWEYSRVPVWGMYLYPFIISLVAPLPLLSAFLKLFNVGAVIAALLFLYFRLSQLRVAPAWRIGFALYLSAVPTWCYVAVVMPDALYGSCFWVLLSALLVAAAADRLQGSSGFVMLGAGAGLLSLLKPHGFFIYLAATAAAVCVAALLPTWRKKVVGILSSVLALSLGYFATAILGNWLTAPAEIANPFDLLGGMYAEYLQSSLPAENHIWAMVSTFFREYCAVVLLYAPTLLSIAVGVSVLMRRTPNGQASQSERPWLIFFGLFILFLVSGLVLVTSIINFTDYRMRFRYVDFAFPALAFLALVFTSGRYGAVNKLLESRIIRSLIAITWVGGAAAFYFFISRDLQQMLIDAPDLFFSYQDSPLGPLNVLGDYGPLLGVSWTCFGALLIAFTRTAPVMINLAVLVPLNVVSLLNDNAAQKVWAAQNLPLTRIGSIAGQACQRKPGKIVILSTNEYYIPYYFSLFNIGRPAMFFNISGTPGGFPRSSTIANPHLMSMIAGADCVLSHLALDSRIFSKEFVIGRMYLYRVRPGAQALLRTPSDLSGQHVLGKIIKVGAGSGDSKFLGDGWSGPEQGYRWTVGEHASLVFELAHDQIRGGTLRLAMLAAAFRGQNIVVEANEEIIERRFIKPAPEEIAFSIPASVVKDDRLRVVFRMPEAVSPKSVGLGDDKRNLGLWLAQFTLEDQP
jgi:hypothetical protein